MAQNFNTWYAKSIYELLEMQQNIQNIEVNMKLSFIKPLHAAWMIEAINSISEDKQLVKQCWEPVGIQHPFALYSKHVQYLFMNLIQPNWELQSTLCQALV